MAEAITVAESLYHDREAHSLTPTFGDHSGECRVPSGRESCSSEVLWSEILAGRNSRTSMAGACYTTEAVV